MNKDFIIHCDDYADSILLLPPESAGRLILALVAYAKEKENPEAILGEDIPAKSLYFVMKGRIDRDMEYRRTKSIAGKKGGAPIGNSNATKQAETSKNKQKQAEDKQKQTPNPNPNPKPINKRHYGECANVLLSDEEYEKIKSQGLTNLIDELSFYIASKGDKYKSHYAVIRQWANRREKEKVITSPMSGQNAKNQFNRYTQRTDYDFEALEKKLIKN